MNTPFEITREEVLELAANKLVQNTYDNDSGIIDRAEEILRSKVNDLFAEMPIKRKVDEALQEEINKLLGQEINPVNIYGEREGKPTTLRAILQDRAKVFWETNVDRDGKTSCYGGEPRSTQMMKAFLDEAFKNALKANVDLVLVEFKKALMADAVKLVTEHIDKFIKVKP